MEEHVKIPGEFITAAKNLSSFYNDIIATGWYGCDKETETLENSFSLLCRDFFDMLVKIATD